MFFRSRSCSRSSLASLRSKGRVPPLLALRKTLALLYSGFFAIFAPAVAKVYIVSFRTHDHRRPSKFIVMADSMKSAVKLAWKHSGPVRDANIQGAWIL